MNHSVRAGPEFKYEQSNCDTWPLCSDWSGRSRLAGQRFISKISCHHLSWRVHMRGETITEETHGLVPSFGSKVLFKTTGLSGQHWYLYIYHHASSFKRWRGLIGEGCREWLTRTELGSSIHESFNVFFSLWVSDVENCFPLVFLPNSPFRSVSPIQCTLNKLTNKIQVK